MSKSSDPMNGNHDEYANALKERTIAVQKAKMETYIALKLQGLPIPPDLQEEVESVLQPTAEPVELEEGDILHVKVGLDADAMGDCGVPWIPTEDDLAYAQDMWESVVPEGVEVVVTHFGMEATVIPVRGHSVDVEITDEAAEFFGLGEKEYPREEGDLLVLGPQVLAALDGSSIIWKGEHFTPTDQIPERVSNRFIDFLYTLARDHLPTGVIEDIMYNFVDTEESSYCNDFIEGYARDLARRLLDDNVPITNWKHMYRSPDGKTKFTGGDNPHYGA